MNEITEIRMAGAHNLKAPGRDLQPVKRDMLHMLTPAHADAVLEACDLLFAALLAYEGGKFREHKATDAVTLVEARLEAGQAEGVVTALFHGQLGALLLTAAEAAPIAFYGLTKASPGLAILDRVNRWKSRNR
jgi:hypothetical protein